MLRSKMLISSAGIVLALLSASALWAQVGSKALQGTWKITEISVQSPEGNWNTTSPQPGLYIFGDGYYSTVIIPGKNARKVFSDSATDAERLAAFDNFVANAGTYEISGSTIHVRPTVAKVPGAMQADADFTYDYTLNGDSLELVLKAAWAGDGEITYRLRRAE